MKTETQAWAHLATLWGNPEDDHYAEDGEVWCLVVIYSIPCSGLCPSINNLYNAETIGLETRDRMLKRLKERYAEITGEIAGGATYDRRYRSYWWPPTRDGATARAEFCRRMAEECVQ